MEGNFPQGIDDLGSVTQETNDGTKGNDGNSSISLEGAL